ncbi:DUF4142 domain-containing protein [Chryseolinea sp. T2]|uniref:DUF4142 domain-containing protein n=1 Tax=Chryseolinea sp. T2 TaxID=3129255 RepID=UPI0030788F2C
MKTLYIPLLLIVFLTASCNKKDSPDSTDMANEENKEKLGKSDAGDDADFAVAAADGGMLEVQLGQLALKNASSQQVKQFAQQMVDDHGKGGVQLKALAEGKGISLPTVLSDKNQKIVDDLSLKTGVEFDKEYAKLMVDDHRKDVDAFRKESEKGNDPELKAWAGETLPMLEHHLQMAESNHKSLQ